VARLLLVAALLAAPVLAADDPALEKRVSALANELRCLVCQNQTLADSNAPLAVDLRKCGERQNPNAEQKKPSHARRAP
jgi:cytochrome c-type biogenesis protein CcmH